MNTVWRLSGVTLALYPRKKNDIITKAAFVEWFVDLLPFLHPHVDEVFDLVRGATPMERALLEIPIAVFTRPQP